MSDPQPFKLTLADVKAAARKADEEGRLGYQNETTQYCQYRLNDEIGGNPCAVGAALPDEVAAKIIAKDKNGDRLDVIIERSPDILEVQPHEMGAIMNIQKAHDAIIIQREYPDQYEKSNLELIAGFKALIAA
jgi:hypothetical protein